jgi:murein DD-endopeptidase MepM/ murein hydrolase activator NlpD
MFGKRHYTFIYVPDDHAHTRRVQLPRLAVLAGMGGLLVIFALAVCFVAGVGRHGTTASPGMTPENEGLRAEVTRLEQRVALLREDLAASFKLQETVAATVGLDTLGSAGMGVGVGGRGPLALSVLPVPGPEGQRVAAIDGTLNQLVRQARIQRQGYQAIVDTLSGRAATRDRIPSIRPVDGGWVTSGYGTRVDPFTGRPTFHEGADFSVPVGTQVHVTADGVVREVSFERGFGNVIIVQHDNRTATRYAHLSRVLVSAGARVKRGDLIALSGRSGRVTSPHLHYELLVGGRPVDPLPHVLEGYAWRR